MCSGHVASTVSLRHEGLHGVAPLADNCFPPAPRGAIPRGAVAMNPAKVVREKVRRFTDLPNIGPAAAKDFELLGFTEPRQLVGADPLDLYESLCAATGARHDPCVLDTFMSVTHFLEGGDPEPWWHFTGERKRRYGHLEIVGGRASPSSTNASRSMPGHRGIGRIGDTR